MADLDDQQASQSVKLTGANASGVETNYLNVDANGKILLPVGAATEAKQDIIITGLQTLNSLVPTTYDYISLGYTGTNLTTVVFKTGGSGGTTISTLTLAYTSNILQSVTKT